MRIQKERIGKEGYNRQQERKVKKEGRGGGKRVKKKRGKGKGKKNDWRIEAGERRVEKMKKV